MPSPEKAAPAPDPTIAVASPRTTTRGVTLGLWVAVLAWMALVTWLSSKPASYFPREDFPMADKIVHTILFTTGAFFAAGSMLVTFRWRRRVVFILTIVAISLFGALDEYHQLSTPGRSGGDVGDWSADTLGAVFGVLLVIRLLRRRPNILPPAPKTITAESA